MKKATLLAISLVLIISLNSCDQRSQSVNADGYTEIKTTEFTILPNDWNLDKNLSNKWVFTKNISSITNSIETNGFVLIYMKAGNAQTWTSLPYTFLDRDTKGNFFSTEYSAWWGVGKVEIQFTDTHPTTPLLPDLATYIKVVTAIDVEPSLMPSKKDYSNYENAKKILNLKD